MNNNPHITFLRPVYIIYMSLAGLPAARAPRARQPCDVLFSICRLVSNVFCRAKRIDLSRLRFTIFQTDRCNRIGVYNRRRVLGSCDAIRKLEGF